jgi:hypothetical protein
MPILSYTGHQRSLYIDPKVQNGGQDNLPEFGLESSTLAFYAGHGHEQDGQIDGWDVPDPDWVPLRLVHIGDDNLRYFWLYSCRVMAHGPLMAISKDYSAPQCFKPGRRDGDVFTRWVDSLGPFMRMVCGGSTRLGSTTAGEIWNFLLEDQTSVADAWVLALKDTRQIPACLARGGPDPGSSALADRTLVPDGVPQEGCLHFQYPVTCSVGSFGSTWQVKCGGPDSCDVSKQAPGHEPETATEPSRRAVSDLPVVTSQPRPSADFEDRSDTRLPLGFVPLPKHAHWKFQPKSGAEVLVKASPDRYSLLQSCDQETTWSFKPEELIERTGVDLGSHMSAPEVTALDQSSAELSVTALEMRVESRLDRTSCGRCASRSLFLLLRSKIHAGNATYPVFGPPALFEFQRINGVPALIAVSTPRRDLKVERMTVPVKAAGVVIAEAHRELQLKISEYPIANARATLGYEAAPLRCLQESLRPTYEVRFFPSEAAQHDRPTVIVRRDARLHRDAADWKCDSWGE